MIFMFLEPYVNGEFIVYGYCLYCQEGIIITENFSGDLDFERFYFDPMDL